jgi:hypothetical protein
MFRSKEADKTSVFLNIEPFIRAWPGGGKNYLALPELCLDNRYIL